jgi:signal transduction histidine kinase/CheY-like chemotaxis protein
MDIKPLYDDHGRVNGAIAGFQDITARKQIETDLRQAKEDLAVINQELEQRVQERTAALERAHDELLREIAEQKNLEAQLRQAQKLESVGTLAGGVAHDFNNILNIILGYSLLIGRETQGNAPVADSLKVIEEEIDRGAALVRRLLTVARKTNAQLTMTNINDALEQLSNLLKQTLPKNIDVVLDLDANAPALLADANQVSQALLNLCLNSRDAMPTGGRLTLRTRLADSHNLPPAGGTPRAEYYVVVEVADNGVGMDDATLSRVFEPFYTTKGQGTGLGLAMVYSIMQNHDGFVTVDSESGSGTRFCLFFPVITAPEDVRARPARKRDSTTSVEQSAHGTILVAEDEARMADLLKNVLSERGYRVLLARNGEEVIQLFNHRGKEIDVVLLDVGLPKIAGGDVILYIREKQPHANIVVASGYLEPAIRSKMQELGVADFIYKPYAPEVIVDKLQALVEKSSLRQESFV